MTRWHTDKPISRIPALGMLRPIAPVSMIRVNAPARASISAVRAFYLNKLRKWAVRHPRNSTASSPAADGASCCSPWAPSR
jgi:hypothetical protein